MEAIKFSFGELKLTNEVINRLAALGYTTESLKEAINKHEQTNGSDSPALYCGTYGKYNAGNLRGMWVNLSTFDNYEDFEAFCIAIHADEADPEIMYQDFANMPRSLYHESMGEEGFNNIMKYCELCDDYSVSAVDDFLEWGTPEDLDNMPDAYVGVYDSPEEFAEEMVNDCYNLEKMMGNLANYFDYEAFARDLFISDYYFGSHGTVIRTC
nr:MAG TPA: antirestriction protein [Caudoviricetes sp.]